MPKTREKVCPKCHKDFIDSSRLNTRIYCSNECTKFGEIRLMKEYQKKYYRSPIGKYQKYKLKAKQRHQIPWDLSFQDFMTFWQKSCHYCGSKIETIGLDRIDNRKGYTLKNLVSCCFLCNSGKQDLSKKAFIQHCKKVVRYQNK